MEGIKKLKAETNKDTIFLKLNLASLKVEGRQGRC